MHPVWQNPGYQMRVRLKSPSGRPAGSPLKENAPLDRAASSVSHMIADLWF